MPEQLEPRIKIRTYYEVIMEIERSHLYSNIATYCLDFLSFEYLDRGYDVAVYNLGLDDEMYEVLRLSELLDPEKRKQYTDKEIKKSYNIQKMFKAGAFKLKNKT